MVIRWLATEIRIFAYFKNLPLMSAFLGLGLGFLWTNRKQDYFRSSVIALIVLSTILILALQLNLTFMSFVDPNQFMLFGIGYDSSWRNLEGLGTSVRTLSIMLMIFALATFVFVGFGQRMGQLFQQLKPLEAYSINVGGALAGTLLFSILCWYQTSPGLWLVVIGLILLTISRKPAHFALITLGLCYSFWLGPKIAELAYGNNYVKTIWSPYYRIDVVGMPAITKSSIHTPHLLGYKLRINYDNFQELIDCSPENLAALPDDAKKYVQGIFDTPFHLLPEPPAKVLSLGAGNGSDIAAALRAGATQIDAVEIDPAIVDIGKALHPEKPYASPKVHLRVMDARTFLQNTHEKYDLVLFAYVDSHAAFSAMSSLRMDNYLFTRESFRKAAECLSPKGILVVKFLSLADWLWDRQAKDVFYGTGTKPLGYCSRNGIGKTGVGTTEDGYLLAGPAIKGKTTDYFKIYLPPREVNLDSKVPMSTDNWPFLFLAKKEVPIIYTLPISLVLFIACLSVGKYFKEGSSVALNWQMFFLGMGFLLLEVRAMADLSLLFGSTWLVNSAVITGILIVILLANWLASRLSTSNLPILGAAVLLSLAVTSLIQAGDLATLFPDTAQFIAVTVYLFPLIFASTMFAVLFRTSTSTSTALAFNLIGGLIGICLEYLSMWLGVRALGWFAFAIYSIVQIIQLPAFQNLFLKVAKAEQ
jgi:hypothetical protein